jgi:hypothetical protein
MNCNFFTIAVCAVLWAAAPALAGQLYRCGSQYQDTPCTNGEPTKKLGASTRPAQAVAGGAAPSAECTARGKDSLNIVWAREAGATRDKQLAEVDGKGLTPKDVQLRKRLIASVYEKRGTSTSIRAEIEAECVAEKEKLKQAQAIAAAAAKLMEEVPADALPEKDATTQPKTMPIDVAKNAPDKEEEHKRYCAGLNEKLTSVRAQLRGGSSAAGMTALNDSKRQLEQSWRRGGC